MHIRCPHCHNAVEIIEGSSFKNVECSSCGSRFSIVGFDAETETSRTETRTIGHFEIIERLGIGSFGSVWKARDTKLDRIVAVKIPRKGQLNERESELFLRDARAAAQLKHSNIVRVYEIGKDGDTIYIAMDYVEGADLSEWMRGQPLPPREAAKLMSGIAEALHHAHENGVIHRDLKPGNVMISRDGQPHIMDFGLAKRESGEITMTVDGATLGTPAYMSPEQARGKSHEADARSDVFSLGVMLYEMLTGTRPFRGEKRMLIVQILDDDPLPLRKLNAQVPRDLETICLKCLEKEPNRRYLRASDLAADLRCWLDAKPIVARPVSTYEKATKLVRRHPVASIVIALTVALSLTTICLAAYLLAVTTQRDRIQEAKERADILKRRVEQLLYTADMKLASDAWMDNDTLKTSELLERHRSLVVDVGYPRFEWHYLSQLIQVDSREIDVADDDVEAIHFSPGGKWLAAGGRDAKIRLYEWPSLTASSPVDSGQGRVSDLTFSADGRTLVSAGYDGSLAVWDLVQDELRPASKPILAHDEPVRSVVFAAEDTLLVSAGLDTRIRLWDARRLRAAEATESQELLVGQLEGHHRGVEALAVSPDGWRLASVSNDATVRVWNLRTLRQVATFNHDSARIVCVAWSRDGKRVAAGDINGNVIVCNVDKDDSRVLTRQLDGVECVAFLDGDRWLATGDRGGVIHLWPLAGEEDAGYGQRSETYPRWLAHYSRVTAFAPCPEGKNLISGSRDGQMYCWSPDPQRCRWVIGEDGREVQDFAFAGQGTRLVVSRNDGVELWDLEARSLIARWAEDQGPWRCVAASPESDVLVTSDSEGNIVAWQLTSREPLAHWNSPASAAWERIVFAPDGNRFAAVAWDRLDEAWIFDLHDVDRSWRVPARQSRTVAFSPDGDHLAVAWMDDGLMYAWESASHPIRFQGHSNTLSDLAFSPDGEMLATVSHDRSLRLWAMQNMQSATQSYAFFAHGDWVRSVAFAPDGRSLITSGDDGRVRLWHAETGQLMLELPNEGRGVKKAAFSPDGWRIVCQTDDNRVVLYDASPGRK